jgi:uncharacterized membrane protein (TIGR02234 family)
MRERAEFVSALLAQLIGAGGALLIAGRHWQSVLLPRPRPFHDYVLPLSGRTIDSMPTAVALVALAGVVAVLATRGLPRRAIGVLVACAGVVLMWRSLAALPPIPADRARALAQDSHAGVQLGAAPAQVSVHAGWVALSCVCAALIVLAGALVAWHGHRWWSMSAKYERPTVRASAVSADSADSADSAERARRRADASLWTALDRGDDPTDSGHGSDTG